MRLSLAAAVLIVAVTITAGCGLVLQGAPRLVAPPNGSSRPCITDPTAGWIFQWSSVPNAINYLLQILDNVNPNIVVFQVAISGDPPATTTTIGGGTLVCGVTYRWRVGATFNGQSAPAWSDTWTVIILP
jgi:hypothetical protein